MARKQLDATQSAEVTAEVPSAEFEVPFTEHEAPVEANDAPLELVTTPGPKKTIRFEGDHAPPTSEEVLFEENVPEMAEVETLGSTAPVRRQPEGLQSIHAGVDRLGPDPRFPGRPRGASLAPVSIRSRTVYTTERGGEVRSYESASSGARTITLSERGREVPFHSSMVDEVIGTTQTNGTDANPGDGLAASETAQVADEPGKTEQPKEERPRRRFGFFGRRSPKVEFKPDGKGDPNIDHTYIPAQPVDSLPAAETGPETAVPAPSTGAGAWDPGRGAASQQVVFEERAPPAAEPEALPETTWKAPSPRRAAGRTSTRRQAKAARKASKRKPLMAYPGDNHPIIDIEGIGPTYAKRLEKAGIMTTGQLAVAQPGRVAAKVNAPKKTVQAWKSQAELLKVKGVGPQFAEAMARAGIDGIDGLKKKSAAKVAAQVTRYLDSLGSTVVGQPVTPKRVAKWKSAADRMRRKKATPAELATPTHGVPPPWLRDTPKATSGRKASRRPARKASGRKKR